MFKRAAQKRREEVRGAEEVQEDENTATELPVDQVDFTVILLKIYEEVKANTNLNLTLIFHVKRAAETVEDEELNNTEDPLSDTQQVGRI